LGSSHSHDNGVLSCFLSSLFLAIQFLLMSQKCTHHSPDVWCTCRWLCSPNVASGRGSVVNCLVMLLKIQLKKEFLGSVVRTIFFFWNETQCVVNCEKNWTAKWLKTLIIFSLGMRVPLIVFTRNFK
jgi:hypothetical protein